MLPAPFPPSAYIYQSLEPAPRTPLTPAGFEAARARLGDARAHLQALRDRALGRAARRALDGAARALDVEAELLALVQAPR